MALMPCSTLERPHRRHESHWTLDAAGEGPDRVGQAYYSALVNAIKSELTDAFFTVGYTAVASDMLGEKSGGGVRGGHNPWRLDGCVSGTRVLLES